MKRRKPLMTCGDIRRRVKAPGVSAYVGGKARCLLSLSTMGWVLVLCALFWVCFLAAVVWCL